MHLCHLIEYLPLYGLYSFRMLHNFHQNSYLINSSIIIIYESIKYNCHQTMNFYFCIHPEQSGWHQFIFLFIFQHWLCFYLFIFELFLSGHWLLSATAIFWVSMSKVNMPMWSLNIIVICEAGFIYYVSSVRCRNHEPG